MVAQKAKVTIFDVAKASGVSSSAVSYALNGKPGVSDATREKVLQVARKLGWRPNGAAQSLAQSRTRRIGLVLGYDPQLLSAEPYIMRLISGLGSALEERDYSLLVRMSMDDDDEVSILEDWIATGNVDALLLLNLEIGDPRIELMKNNPQMPCLALADSSLTSGLPTLMSDDAAASGTMIRHLALFGHKNIARVADRRSSATRTSATPRSRRSPRSSACATAACTPTTRRNLAPRPPSDCSAWNRGRPRSSTTTT